MPHGLRVVGVIASHVLRGLFFQVKEPDVRRHASAIPFPRREVGRDRGESQRPAIRGNRAKFTVGHRQFLRQAALHRDLVELRHPFGEARHMRGIEQRLAVRVPAEEPFAAAVMRNPARFSAAHRHDVEVHIAIVIPGEGELRSVRRKARELLDAAWRAQPQRRATSLWSDPDIAPVDEGDGVFETAGIWSMRASIWAGMGASSA